MIDENELIQLLDELIENIKLSGQAPHYKQGQIFAYRLIRDYIKKLSGVSI